MTFWDGLGYRQMGADASGGPAEYLCLRRDLTTARFENALREQAARFEHLHHEAFARVRSIQRVSTGGGDALVLVSDAAPGVRLLTVLADTRARGVTFDLGAALSVVRQSIAAVAALHYRIQGAAHGALAPERLVLRADGRVVITEAVLGPALEQLRYSRERYWAELRIALPRLAGLPRFDQLADTTGIGMIALSCLLGRVLDDDEYPGGISRVVAGVLEEHREPCAPALRVWLERTLQIDPRSSFPSAVDAGVALDQLIAESGLDVSTDRVQSVMASCYGPRPTGEPRAASAASAASTRRARVPQIVRTRPRASMERRQEKR